MSETVIRIEQLGKSYRLGVIGSGSLHGDLSRWWARVRKQPDPLARIDDSPGRTPTGEVVWALRGVDLDVPAGEVVGLIGRNGAGKSTLLKILSRVTAPTEGRARAKGKIASLLEVGTGFHPELTGRENIYLNGAMLGMSKAQTRRSMDDIVGFAEVEQYLDTPVKRYSSGMYVRLAFAVAANLDAEILLVDEVLAVGDLEFQRKSLGKMGDVADSGRTVLFVSHNMGAVSRICTSAALIDKGRIVERGPTADVVGAYFRSGHVASDVVTEFESRPSGAFFVRAWFETEHGEKTTQIPVTSAFDVVLEYDVEEPHKNMCVAITVADKHGSSVFFTEERSISETEGPGRYTGRARIPAGFLAPAQFSATLDIHTPNVTLFDSRRHALSFEILETGSPASQYAGSDVGSVLVDLAWKQERMVDR